MGEKLVAYDDGVYEEIHIPSRENTQGPDFPDACPACGAEVAGGESAGERWAIQIYACGGKYLPKPQIQNHTDKWWGKCPKVDRCKALGLSLDVPMGVLRDAEKEAGLVPM